MQLEQLNRAVKAINAIKNSEALKKIYSIEFSRSEVKLYADYDKKIAGYLVKRKFKTQITNDGFIFCRKQVGAISVLVVLW